MPSVVFGLLALGPYLRIGGLNTAEQSWPVPLPYLLFRELPFMDIHRIPSRFVSMVTLALAVLVGLALAWLWEAGRRHRLALRWRWVVLVVLTAGMLFEYWPRPFTLTPIGSEQIPPVYRAWASEGPGGPILEVPDLDYLSMFYQTHHRRPTTAGNISRPRGHVWRRMRLMDPMIRVMATWDDMGVDQSPAAIRSALRCQGIEQVVFYQQAVGQVTRKRIDAVEAYVFGDIAPDYADEATHVYTVELERPAQPYWTHDPNEWYELDLVGDGQTPGRWAVGGDGSLLIVPCGQEQVAARFAVAGIGGDRTLEVLLNDQLLTTMALREGWIRQVQLLLPLQPGTNRLRLRSIEPPTTAADRGQRDDPRELSFNLSQVSIEVAGTP
ncbi:MAG: hypothetical protein HC837_02595 [Chloroflexaceae bacterium]|nr:hypothetical protein [Chloroflexaceae bacterium]